MKKKNAEFLKLKKIFLFFIFIAAMLIFISKEVRIFISKPLRTENLMITNAINLLEFKLEISKEIQEKFDIIYSKYSENHDSKEYNDFLKYLNKNNRWEKTKLLYNKKTYNILVKLHGKTPTHHVENGYYSLGIKVLDDEKINGVSRFNLIVYWRIRYNADIVKYFAEKTGVHFKENKLINLNINDKANKLYYFEFRTNTEYFKNIKKNNFIALKYKSDHSLVYSEGDLKNLERNLKKAINKTNHSDSLKNMIWLNYISLNSAVYKKDVETVLSYFDINYLAKVQAFRYLFADDGHGFSNENLLIAFNTHNKKFYPFIHRDNSPYTLQNLPEIDGKFNGSDIIGISGPLFTVFSKSTLLASKTKSLLTKILKSESVNSLEIDSIIKVHNSYYYSSNIKQNLGLQTPQSSSIIIEKLNKSLINSID